MLNWADEWFPYAIGAVCVALGISVCFAPKERSFMKIGSKRAPAGTRPMLRWTVVLVGLSIAFAGVDLMAYKLIASEVPRATPVRQVFFMTTCFCLTWSLAILFAGLGTRADLSNGRISDDADDYRASAFLGAFVCLLFALVAAYFGLIAH